MEKLNVGKPVLQIWILLLRQKYRDLLQKNRPSEILRRKTPALFVQEVVQPFYNPQQAILLSKASAVNLCVIRTVLCINSASAGTATFRSEIGLC